MLGNKYNKKKVGKKEATLCVHMNDYASRRMEHSDAEIEIPLPTE